MTRKEIFFKTREHIAAYLFVVFFNVMIHILIILAALVLERLSIEELCKNFGAAEKPLAIAILLLTVFHWKYFFDIIFGSTEVFTGKVCLGERILLSKMESGGGAQWTLFEASEKGRGRKFKIFKDKMCREYGSQNLLSEMCQGTVTFRYMKYSRYIVEIIDMKK